MPTVLIAADKFKGSLTAAQVADAVGKGVRRVRPDAQVESVPVADGGRHGRRRVGRRVRACAGGGLGSDG